uniref:ankyrin repeat domain-containing protein 16-like isoform X1 n=1 Tax=Myxine glutinosa TaxID=7769 RepID=UPI00358F20B8
MATCRPERIFRLVQDGDSSGLRAFGLGNDVTSTLRTLRRARSGDTLVHVAARKGDLDLLRYLLEELSLDLEVPNREYKRPLHEAASMGHRQCVRYLLERGAQVDSLKSGDWTPLMLACTRVNVEVVRELIQWGAQLNLRNKDGWNAFQIASRQGDLATVCFLLQASPDIWMTRSKVSRSPLHTAALQTNSFHYPVFSALHGHLDVVAILLQRCGYRPDERDSCGVTPFMDALKRGHVEVARLLMDTHKADERAADALGAQALHQAAMTGQDRSIEFLVTELRVDVNSRATSLNLTALHYAAKEGHTKTILTLRDLGADLQATDAKGRTARGMASARGHAPCAQALDQTCMHNHTSTTDFTAHALPPKLLHQSSPS